MRASLSKATVKTLIDHGVSSARLDQPWISMKDYKRVCGGFEIGCEICSRLLDKIKTVFIRTEMATFSCASARKDALRKHQLSQQHQKSVLQELGFQLGPKGKPLVGKLPSEVFREVLANRDRLRNVRFCLLEAKHEQGQGFH